MVTYVSIGSLYISVSIGLFSDFERQYLPYLLIISPFLPNCLFFWLVDAVDLLENEFTSNVVTEGRFLLMKLIVEAGRYSREILYLVVSRKVL